MALSPGTRLGVYEVTAQIGAGGMGEVYKGRDTRLDRTVAIKILPDNLAADPQFRERFDREARTISRFTHPNICTLYDVGEAPVREPSTDSHQPSAISHDTVQFLVMELLDGETLESRCARASAAVTICPADVGNFDFGRMNWDASGIFFNQAGRGIMRVSANGGQPEVLVSVKDGELMYGPQVLPGGEWLLFTIATGATATATTEGWDKAQIVVQSLKSSERKTLVSGGSDARYVPTGHIVYALGGVLFAVPFDLRRLAVTGGPVPIVEGVKRSSGISGTAHFCVSSTGALVYVPGPASTGSLDLALVDRNGAVQPLKLPPGAYEYPRLSPDGKRIAFGTDDGKDAIVWIYDVAGASSARRLTLGGRNRVPVWSADGERVAFQSTADGDLGLSGSARTARRRQGA